jgi:hypothetical protein
MLKNKKSPDGRRGTIIGEAARPFFELPMIGPAFFPKPTVGTFSTV